MDDQTETADTPDKDDPKVDPNQKVTIKLRMPFEVGSKSYAELTLRPVTGKDMRLMPVDDKRPVAGVMWMAGRLSGQTQAVTDKLVGSDLKAVINAVNGFLEDTQESGDESSES